MSHVRTQIRNRVATLLTGLAPVYASRVYPLAESALPVILVYTDEEEIAVDEAAFGTLQRQLTATVEIVAKSTTEDALDDVLDDLLVLAETALAADPTLNGLAISAVPSAIAVSVDSQGALPVGRARLTYAVLYRTAPTDPNVSI